MYKQRRGVPDTAPFSFVGIDKKMYRKYNISIVSDLRRTGKNVSFAEAAEDPLALKAAENRW